MTNEDIVREALTALQSFIQCGENFTETVAATWCEGIAALDALVAERDEAQRIAVLRSETIESFADKLHASEVALAELKESLREIVDMPLPFYGNEGQVAYNIARAALAKNDE